MKNIFNAGVVLTVAVMAGACAGPNARVETAKHDGAASDADPRGSALVDENPHWKKMR